MYKILNGCHNCKLCDIETPQDEDTYYFCTNYDMLVAGFGICDNFILDNRVLNEELFNFSDVIEISKK